MQGLNWWIRSWPEINMREIQTQNIASGVSSPLRDWVIFPIKLVQLFKKTPNQLISPCSLFFVAEFACKVVKMKKWECSVSLKEDKAKKQYNQGFGNRSSSSEMFFKIGTLKNFAIFTGKRVFLWILWNY